MRLALAWRRQEPFQREMTSWRARGFEQTFVPTQVIGVKDSFKEEAGQSEWLWRYQALNECPEDPNRCLVNTPTHCGEWLIALAAELCLLSILAGSGFGRLDFFGFTSVWCERSRHNINNYLMSYIVSLRYYRLTGFQLSLFHWFPFLWVILNENQTSCQV